MSPALSKLPEGYDSVRHTILRALEVIRSDHFEDYFDLCTPDALWMMPSSHRDIGIEEAKQFYGFTKNFRFDQEVTVDELVVVDDLAYVRVTFDGYLRPKKDQTAQPLRSVSRHIWILRRQAAGDWKISRDVWNNPKQK